MSEDIEYRVMTEDDITEVKRLLYESFYKDEPLAKSLDIDPGESAVYVESITELSAQSNMSIVAVSKKSGDIIGCSLNTVETPSIVETVCTSPDNPKHTKIRIIDSFMKRLNEGINVFQHYGVDKCMHVQVLSVRNDFTGRHVANRMLGEGLKVSESAGIRFAVAETTGKQIQKILEKAGCDVLNEVKYVDFCDVNGDVIFKNMGIHTSGQLVAKFIK